MADDELAIKYLEEDTAQGHSRSIMTIAEALTIGGVGYEVDYQRASHSFSMSCLATSKQIQLQLIRTLEPDLAELIEAQQSLIRLSDMGHEDAMYALLQLDRQTLV